jgi:hypothetical protein
MSNSKKLLQAAAGAAGDEALNVEDVFSTYLYTGNDTSQTITNGIDLDGEGGMTWLKTRDDTHSHYLFDTERGAGYYLNSDTAGAQAYHATAWVTGFNSDGFDIGYSVAINDDANDHASWTFRKAPKFFDVVTYSGSVGSQSIAHNLGSTPGLIITKKLDSSGNWAVYHRSLGATKYILLNSTSDAQTSSTFWNDTEPTSTHFTVGTNDATNNSVRDYVAYLFAHNDGDGEFGPDGDADIIKCGSFTTDSGGNASVDIGFEPQWIIYKRSDGTSNWGMNDNMRGWADTYWNPLYADASNAESGFAATRSWPTATGFEFEGQLSASANYIYIAIRRGPMAVPEDATDVFDVTFDGATDGKKPYIRSDTGVVDLIIANSRTGTTYHRPVTRLTSGRYLQTTSSAAEVTQAGWEFDFQNGVYDLAGSSVNTNGISWMWKRAPNFCDVVAYKGNGVTDGSHKISHNLGVVPEMMWVKGRDVAYPWVIYHKDLTSSQYSLYFDAAAQAQTYQFNVDPISTEFTVASNYVNNASYNYIAYLFASLDGVSKVGSYTGNGSTLSVDCGFSSGPRFVLIKRTDSNGHWCVYDSERGITSTTSPVLRLNNTDAENSSYDDVDITPSGNGFIVDAINGGSVINASGGTYIFYAIA